MSTELDRQQATREARDFYAKASLTGRPMGPNSPVYSFYDDASGIYRFFKPGDRYVVYAKHAHPKYSTRLLQSSYGPPLTIPGQNRSIEIQAPAVAFGTFREAILHPADYSYVAVFDMWSPTWMVPLDEFPRGRPMSASTATVGVWPWYLLAGFAGYGLGSAAVATAEHLARKGAKHQFEIDQAQANTLHHIALQNALTQRDAEWLSVIARRDHEWMSRLGA